jgi:hypothetical protein
MRLDALRRNFVPAVSLPAQLFGRRIQLGAVPADLVDQPLRLVALIPCFRAK